MFKKISLVFFIIIISAGALEILARKFYPVVQIEKIRFIGDSLGETGHFKLSKDPVLLYEWKEWPQKAALKKEKGVFRVIVLGDSVVFRPGKSLDEFFPKKCESLLNRASSRIRYEVINFGVPGYNTNQEVRSLETQLLSYTPDMVIIGYCSSNDRTVKRRVIRYKAGLFCSDVAERYPYIEIAGPGINQVLMKYSYFYRLINTFFITLFNLDRRDLFTAGNGSLGWQLNLSPALTALLHRYPFAYPPKTRQAVENFSNVYRDKTRFRLKYYDASYGTQGAVKKLKILAQKGKFDLLFVVFPRLSDGPQKESDWIIEQCRQDGIKTLDLRPVFEKEGYENLRATPKDVIHPNDRGNELIARQIAEMVVSSGAERNEKIH